MKTLKYFICILLFLFVIYGIPTLVFNNIVSSPYLVQVEGAHFPGITGHYEKLLPEIMNNTQVNTEITQMIDDANLEKKEQKKSFLILTSLLSVMLCISIIILSNFLLKHSDSKLIFSSLLTSGILSLLLYLVTYVAYYIIYC